MRVLTRYFLRGRPFAHLPTVAVHLLLVGNGLGWLSGVARTIWLGWPSGWLGWLLWLLPVAALYLLGLVVWAAGREYYRRPDRPRRIWHITLPPEP